MVLLLELFYFDRLQGEVFVLEAGTLLASVALNDLFQSVPTQLLDLEELLIGGVTLTFTSVDALRPSLIWLHRRCFGAVFSFIRGLNGRLLGQSSAKFWLKATAWVTTAG